MLGRNRKKGETEEKTPGRSRIEVLDAEHSDGEEISEKKDKKLSEDRLQNHVVASLTPPLLKTCENLLVLLLFLEKFQDYQNLGGTISLFHCAYDVIKNRLDFEERDWASVSEKDLQVALKLAFAPSSSFLVLDLLNQVQLRNQGSMSLNVDGLRHGTQLYVQIASWRSGMAISKSLIFETFLGKLRSQAFREYLTRSGLRDQEYSEWPKFIVQRALEFNETRLAAKMMGMSLQEGKPSCGKSLERSFRQQGSQESSESKELKGRLIRLRLKRDLRSVMVVVM